MTTERIDQIATEISNLIASIPKVYASAKTLHTFGMMDETPEDLLDRYIKMNPRISEASSYAVSRGIVSREQLEPIKSIDLTIQRCSWFNENGLILTE